jgi:putative ABC transport system substrate-binding protein
VITTTGGIPAALAAKTATTGIPIVFWIGADPVQSGLVDSLHKPGRNLTGVTTLGTELNQKRLELARDLLPNATSMALLVNPTLTIAERQSRDMQAAARSLGLQLHVLHASMNTGFEPVFTRLGQLGARALVVSPDALFNSDSKTIAALSIRYAVPTIYQYQPFIAAGGLMSYGADLAESYRLTGLYTARVLKGEKPADLPVQQATKVQLILNLKTAKALGIVVPATLLARADEVIE